MSALRLSTFATTAADIYQTHVVSGVSIIIIIILLVILDVSVAVNFVMNRETSIWPATIVNLSLSAVSTCLCIPSFGLYRLLSINLALVYESL